MLGAYINYLLNLSKGHGKGGAKSYTLPQNQRAGYWEIKHPIKPNARPYKRWERGMEKSRMLTVASDIQKKKRKPKTNVP